MLEIVLVTAEYHADGAARKKREQLIHAIGISVLRSGAERRVVTKSNTPARPLIGGERLLDPFAVLWILEQPFPAEEALLRRVETDELDVAPEAKAVEQSRIHRGASRGLFAGDALAQIQVVEQLLAIVVIFGLGGVVVADAGIHGHAVHHVSVRLEESKEPVVVFV